jgi:hypothetical protein
MSEEEKTATKTMLAIGTTGLAIGGAGRISVS